MRVPLILLTGFLGAGKTTLLNGLLKRTRNIGVVVNELGEVGIDGALLQDTQAKQIELPGGCVCCVLGEDLDRTLIDLVDTNPHLEAIVLETTGVAEPLPIAWALDRPDVSKRVRLATVVTLVDALNFRASRPLSVSVDAQVAYADVLLVTKSTLAGEAETSLVTAEIRTLASQALLQIGDTATHVAWLEQLLSDPPINRPLSGQDRSHVHDENCRHLDDRAVHGIDSVWTAVTSVVDLEELEDALAELPANYVRIKGILKATDGCWFAVHRVGPRVSSEPVEPPDFKEGRLVALGSQVDGNELFACVRRAMTPPRA
ncbi:MAG: GTP-binding protein [Myxococcota bacterium]|nr:GTP-binding protein [Myxococcota bacterium]